MKGKFLRIFIAIVLISLISSPAMAQAPKIAASQELPPNFVTPTRPEPKEVPQELQDLFKDGMTVEEFLLWNKGPIPNALLQFADIPLMVIVQLDQPSLIDQMASENAFDSASVESYPQKEYTNQLLADQAALLNQINGGNLLSNADGFRVISQYTKVLNGFLMQVSAQDLNAIRSLPGVKSVTRAPRHELNLSTSIPLIGADDVWNLIPVGFKGAGVEVAIIDTGVDYTHAMFGGTGTTEAYDLNDPDVVETDSFPTVKVIGGWDFAGTAYNANVTGSLPVPDADPLDENGHGTHVASTSAGVDVGFGSGVAPEASIYALKVFGASGSTNLVVDAIEWALDPNGDDDISDHVDVINMSLGSSFGPNLDTDPELIALEAANLAGVFVVASAGNAGDTNYVVGSPSVSDSALSVAASTTGFETAPFIEYTIESVEYKIPYTTSDNAFTETITAELVAVDSVDGGGTGLLCDATGVTPGALTGKIALISRGTCSFYIKINVAESLGAVAAIIYNNAAGIISMATAGSTLPAGSILQSDGLILKDLAPIIVSVGPDSNTTQFVSPYAVDTIADFSSRGPRGFDSKLKPEITAPGVAIFAADIGSGNLGTSMSGTSMAAPHIAGVAVLMKQAHPTWTNEEIKAAIMNTAVDLADVTSRQVPLQGAGRVDAFAAVTTDVVAIGDDNLVSLSWGLIEIGSELNFEGVKPVTLRNFGSTPVTVSVGSMFTSNSAGATLTPSVSSIVVPANGSATVDFYLSLDATLIFTEFDNMEEYYGYVTFGDDVDLRLPFYFIPRPYGEITIVEEVTTFDINSYGYVALEQTGPIASDIWTFPTTIVSEEDPTIEDMADVRYVGLNRGDDPSYGVMIMPAFAMWAPQHTNQSYWSEVDMYIDADNDGSTDVVNFNYNLGAANGGDPDNSWIVFQYDFNAGDFFLASPYFIYADFNSGFQEWYLPVDWNYVSDVFAYEVYSYDWYGTEKFVGFGQFDISKPPFGWHMDPIWATLDPHNESFTFNFVVYDKAGYHYSQPEGIMLVDYNGKPGVGQVLFWELDPRYFTHFPLITK